MKVIGKTEENLICEVSKDEICRVFNIYSEHSLRSGGTIIDPAISTELNKNFVIGGSIDLSMGYKFRDEIKKLCENMNKTVKDFESAQKTLLAFSEMVTKQKRIDDVE